MVFRPGYENMVNIFCRKNKEDFLRKLARDNTQLLFNAIWKVQAISSISIVNQTFGIQTQHQTLCEFDFKTSRTQSNKSNPSKLSPSLKNRKAYVYWSKSNLKTPVLQKTKSLEIKHSTEVVCPIIFVRVQFHLITELSWAESMGWVWLRLIKI